MEAIFEFLKGVIESSSGQYAIVAKVLMIVGALRVIFKPVMSLVQASVGLTKSVEDDALLAKVMESKGYKVLSYVLDWSASIKLPQKK